MTTVVPTALNCWFPGKTVTEWTRLRPTPDQQSPNGSNCTPVDYLALLKSATLSTYHSDDYVVLIPAFVLNKVHGTKKLCATASAIAQTVALNCLGFNCL